MSRINIVLQSASLLLEYPDERLLDRLNLIEAALALSLIHISEPTRPY